MEKITLGAGCFWCIETALNEVRGISSALSGYMGGHTVNPTYKDICTGTSGHAEVVEVTFNPALISLETILNIFWTMHDPTTLNRQGNDRGTQYRSAIFYHNDEQLPIINKSIEDVAKSLWDDPIVTQVEEASVFYTGEKYHQNYYKTNPGNPYCSYIITPKISKFRSSFKDLLK